MKAFCKMFVLALCFFATVAIAQTPEEPKAVTIDSFDARFSISIDGNNAFYAITLPAAVYERSHSPFLNDVRIFNHSGVSVPYLLRLPADTIQSSDIEREDLKFFPVYENTTTSQSNPSSVIIDTTGKPALAISTTKTESKSDLIAYVIETPKLLSENGGNTDLTFDWSNQNPSFIKHISIEGSTDLQSWTPFIQDYTLARFQHASQLLEKKTCSIYITKGTRYLRLRWSDESPIQLTKILARFGRKQSTPSPRLELSAPGTLTKDGVLYDLKGNFPVRNVMIVLPESNTFLNASLSTCPQLPCNGHQIAETLLYRLNVQNSEISNDAIDTDDNTYRFWKIVSSDGTYPFDEPAPKLTAKWTPHRLIFLAQGPGPFELAVGSDHQLPVLNQSVTLAQLVDSTTGDIPEAKLAAPQDKTQPQPVADKPGNPSLKTYLLWAIMIACTATLAVIAARLFRETKDNEKSD